MTAAVKLQAPVKERPILFSGPMVRALLEGRKTQTRRVVKPTPWRLADKVALCLDNTVESGRPVWHFSEQGMVRNPHVVCPYGQPGDRLWVRETWGYRGSSWNNQKPDEHHYRIDYQADGARREFRFGPERPSGLPSQPKVTQLDRDSTPEEQMEYHDALTRYWRAWRPSIHMPRWASRLTLEVTEVRVERLQDISARDAILEGIERTATAWRNYGQTEFAGDHVSYHDSPRDSFRSLWSSINGADSWDANPWVWVVSFAPAPDGRAA